MAKKMIPGAASLGCCIDINGDYDAANGSRPLFDLSTTTTTFTWGQEKYDLPSNIAQPQIISAGTGTSSVFKSKEDFASTLGVKAKISGSYGGFEGEASAKFNMSSDIDVEVTLATYTTNYDSFRISLQNPSANDLSPSVKGDPDFLALPSQFDAADNQNVQLFERFFAKFGTHFIDTVTCGAQLNMYAWAENTKISQQTSVGVTLSASYKALFSVKGTASADWSSINKSDFDNSNIRIEVKGGSTSILNAVTASYGDNLNADYQQWLASVADMPAPRDFTVAEISVLFSGAQRQAVSSAIVYFLSNSLRIFSDPVHMVSTVTIHSVGQGAGLWTTVVSDGPFKRSPMHPGWFFGGMFVLVIDRTTLDKKLEKTYDVSSGRFVDHAEPPKYDPKGQGDTWADRNYAPALADLASYQQDPNAIILVMFPFCSSLHSYPSVQFSAFLRGLVGSTHANIDELTSHETSMTEQSFSYLMVGVPHRPDLSFDSIQFGQLSSALLVLNRRLFLRPRFGAKGIEYEPFKGW